MIQIFENVVEDFDYDLWANNLWRECLASKATVGPDVDILGHILSAQTIWLKRCQGVSLTAMPKIEPTELEMTALTDAWKELLSNQTEDSIINYKRTTGEELELRISEITNHVINHGTYHRGELRGLCRSRGDDDFPETDRARFTLLTRKQG